MKIFIDINNKKIESNNKSEPNYYLLKFKDIEIKDEFQDFNFNIVNNIEVKLSMKVKNKFNSQKVGNLFQKFQPIQNKKEGTSERKSVIGTGVNMKERLAIFSNNNKKENNTTNTNYIPKKLKIPANLAGINSKDNKKENVKEIKNYNKEIKEKKDDTQKNKEEVINKVENEEKPENINNNIQEEKNVEQNQNIENLDDNENIQKNETKEEKAEEIKKEENIQENETKEEKAEEIKNEENIKEEEIQEKENGSPEETNNENENNQKEEIQEEKQPEEFSSDKDDNDKEQDEIDNININLEIRKKTIKEEKLKIRNPIGQEKNITEKKFLKRPSHAFNFTNPLEQEVENENDYNPRPRGMAQFTAPHRNSEKQEIQKSQKILEKSNMFKNLMQKKNSEEEEEENKESKESKESKENNKKLELLKRNASLNVEKLNIKSKKKN